MTLVSRPRGGGGRREFQTRFYHLVSDHNMEAAVQAARHREGVRIFLAEVAFSVFKHDLDQHPRLLSALRVGEQSPWCGDNRPPPGRRAGCL